MSVPLLAGQEIRLLSVAQGIKSLSIQWRLLYNRVWYGTGVRLKAFFKRSFSFLLSLAGVFFLLCAFVAIGSLNFSGLLICGSVSSLSFYFSQRFRARSADAVLLNDHRPPLVYLRSFGADQGYQGGRWFRLGRAESDEEALSRLLRRIGPLVAIGKPGEFLPLLGASRIYVADECWQETVSDLLSKAALLILRVGATDGLLWEVTAAREAVHPSKLLIWHPHYGRLPKRRRYRDAVYQAFRSRVDQEFHRPLPEVFPRNSEFLFFTDDWTPRFTTGKPSFYARLRGFMSLSRLPRLHAELRNVLLNANLAVPRMPWRPIEFVNFYIFLLPLFAVAIIAVSVVVGMQPLRKVPAEFQHADASWGGWSPVRAGQRGTSKFLRTELDLRLSDGAIAQAVMVCDFSDAVGAMRVGLYLPNGVPLDLRMAKSDEPPEFNLVTNGFRHGDISELADDGTVFSNAVTITMPFGKAPKVVAPATGQSGGNIGSRLSALASKLKAEIYRVMVDRANRLSNATSASLELTAEDRRHYKIDLHPRDVNFQALVSECRARGAHETR